MAPASTPSANEPASKCFFCYLFLYFFADPLPSFNWWAVAVGGSGGRGGIKWRQLAHHQLMS